MKEKYFRNILENMEELGAIMYRIMVIYYLNNEKEMESSKLSNCNALTLKHDNVVIVILWISSKFM